MKKSLFGIIAIASMVMTGCTQEVEQLVMDDMKNVKFTGTIEDVDTRTSMDNTGKVIWCENDLVSIFMRNGNHYKYQANSGGTTKTTFAYANWYAKGTASLDQNYAVYPFDEDNAFDATTKKFTVDLSGLAKQTYTENNFEEGKSVMTAKATGTDLPFYNALSMLKVRLSSSVPEAYRITEIKIESKTKVLSGEDATIDLSGEDGRVAAVLTSGENTITLDCGDDEDGVVISTEPTDFYILVPVNEIPAGDFTITITGTDAFTDKVYTTDEIINKDFTFGRSEIVGYERKITAEDWKGSIEDVIGNNDIVLKEDHAEVFSANGLLKWAYIANNSDNSYGLKLMNDIEMPEYEIEEDAVNETYRFTEKAITVTDGVPSGSNWIPVRTGISNLSEAYSGHIEGNNNTISRLYIKLNQEYAGLIGYAYDDVSVKNLTIENSIINGKGYVGAIMGESQHNSLVENVQVKNTKILGTGSVGGIVGHNYSRNVKADGTFVGEKISIIKNCTIDNNSSVYGTGSDVGGICGGNNGAAVIYCVNNADVTGKTNVGGVVGMNRPYNTGREGYVVACSSTADATIHAADHYAGGIVGLAFKDGNQENTIGHIVACYSLSTVTGKNNATLVGFSTNGTIRSSWAVKNGLSSYSHKSNDAEPLKRICSEHFDTAEDVNAEFVNEINQAIADYNNIEGIEITCPYTWSWTSGSWPVLVEQ